jgi:hypothetical protein
MPKALKYFLAFLGLGLVISTTKTANAAISSAQILAYLRGQNQTCEVSIDKSKMISGYIKGSSKLITVIPFGVESCGGGNNWFTDFLAFYDDGGTMVVIPHRSTAMEQSVFIKNSEVSAHSLEYGPNDPHCCPSLVRHYRFVDQGNKLVLAPDSPNT